MTGIYSITNLVNNKKYIGQAVDIESRWKDHIRELKKGTHHNYPLQNAWNKYGMNNFSFTVLYECGIEELNMLEIEYIEKYKTFMHRQDEDVRGYNLTIGGDMGTRGRYGVDATNTKQIICLNTMKVYKCAKDACDEYGFFGAALSNHLLRKPKHKSCGKDTNGQKLLWEYYDETKDEDYYMKVKDEKLDILKINKNSLSKVKPKAKSVICINTGEIFRSICEANDVYNTKGVGQACTTGYSAGKDLNGISLKWMYYDEYKKLNKESEVI